MNDKSKFSKADMKELAPFLYTLDNFLTSDECNAIIASAKKSLTPSGLRGKHRPGYRTSKDSSLSREKYPDLVGKIESAMVEITGLPLENQEDLHILKYEVGEEYKVHHDFWHERTPYYNEENRLGGQRVYTALVYLNTVTKGGGTAFPKIDLEITPELGKLLVWKNIVDGKLNYDSLHAALPVLEGEKWAAVKWIREKEFAEPPVDYMGLFNKFFPKKT